MERQLISTSSIFEQDMAFSRAVVVDNLVFVSGCTGYDYSTMTISDDLVEQTEQTFQNIIYTLTEAGSSLKDVVKVTYLVADAEDFKRCYPVLRKYLADVLPACTAYCATLVNDKLKIEIEVTAVKNNTDRNNE